MATKSLHITHLFEGGWATAYGPSAPGTPIEGNVLRIPFLNNAENVLFELDGGPRKCPGTTRVNAAALEAGAEVMGMVDFWRQGTGGSPAQRRVIHIGTKVYADSGDGTFSEIASGLQDNAIPNYAIFDDLLIIASDNTGDVPRSWDQTTFQNLAGSPPRFSFSCVHKNFLFAAGNFAAPSTLYYSSQLDPETWSGGTSGTISIDPNDGDMITGLISHKDELWVFKGPNKGSIHRITGSSNSDWARTSFIKGVGAVWSNSIFRFGDDIGFLWADGSVRSLSVTAQYGDFREAALTFPIQDWLDDHINFTHLRKAWAVADPTGRRVFFSVPVNTSTTNNTLLVLDFRFTPPRWSQLSAYAAASIAVMADPNDNKRRSLYLGGQDGFVRKFGNSTRAIDTTTAINYLITTPFLDYAAPEMKKTLAGVGLGIQPRSSGNITFNWRRDDDPAQTASISQGGSGTGVLSPGASGSTEFTLDTSMLGGNSFKTVWNPMEEGGEFRSVQFEFANSTVNEDVELHHFVVKIEPGAASMENG